MRQGRAFTLIELLVVIAILALLLAILAPSLSRAKRLARRAVCRSRLHGIGTGMNSYAAANRGFVIPCRFRSVQLCLNYKVGSSGDDAIDWVAAAAAYNMKGDIWECPDRPGAYTDNDIYYQMLLGYQYFGGIRTWTNPWGKFPSRSPDQLGVSGSGWVLAADCTMKIDSVWGGGRPSAYANMPQHRADDPWPEGGNHVYADGSAGWVEFQKMIYIHSWGGWARIAYWYQRDLGEFVPPEAAMAKP